MRQRIFEIIDVGEENDNLSKLYDVSMMIIILVSLIPLTIKNQTTLLVAIDKITAVIFVIDYIFRWITADYSYEGKTHPFAKYPVQPMAIIDLISILPSFVPISGVARLLKVIRLARTLRVFRVVRYSKNVRMLINVFRKQKEALSMVLGLAVGYILISALVMFNIEPDTFNNYFEAIYWATISLTSVGYGDVYAITTGGRVITMISAVFGIAIVALPSGIITAGYLSELNGTDKKDEANE